MVVNKKKFLRQFTKFNFVFLSAFFHLSCNEVLSSSHSCENGTTRRGNVCVSDVYDLASMNCKDPDLTKVLKGKTITLCNGTLAEGKMEACSKDGQVGCIANGEFKSIEKSSLSSKDFLRGVSIGGVNGSKPLVKNCRNGANLSYFDLTSTDIAKKIPQSIGSYPGGGVVQLSAAHGLSNDDPIQIVCSGGVGTALDGGEVVINTTYYTSVITTNRIQFKSSPSSGTLNVTGIGGCTGGTWVVVPPKDGVLVDFDTIDDMNGLASITSSPKMSPWDNEFLCGASNFSNVTNTENLKPTNTVPPNGNIAWSQIWKDESSGVLFTNVLYDGSQNNKQWAKVNTMCKSLDSISGGSAGTGWRLPTQKELMQLYINGISKVPLAGLSNNLEFWSSTAAYFGMQSAWAVNISTGYMTNGFRLFMHRSGLCLR